MQGFPVGVLRRIQRMEAEEKLRRLERYIAWLQRLEETDQREKRPDLGRFRVIFRA